MDIILHSKKRKQMQENMQDYLEIKISDLVDEDSKEYKSLLDLNKYYNMQRVNTNLLNTRGIPNKEEKIGRFMRFKLAPFDILHFDKIELVTTSGGVFYNGKIVQENTGGFGKHSFVNSNYNFYKKLQKRFFIPTNMPELKQVIKVIISFFAGKEQKQLKSDKQKIIWHSPNWDCFSHFSFEEFPRLIATLKALYDKKQVITINRGGAATRI